MKISVLMSWRGIISNGTIVDDDFTDADVVDWGVDPTRGAPGSAQPSHRIRDGDQPAPSPRRPGRSRGPRTSPQAGEDRDGVLDLGRSADAQCDTTGQLDLDRNARCGRPDRDLGDARSRRDSFRPAHQSSLPAAQSFDSKAVLGSESRDRKAAALDPVKDFAGLGRRPLRPLRLRLRPLHSPPTRIGTQCSALELTDDLCALKADHLGTGAGASNWYSRTIAIIARWTVSGTSRHVSKTTRRRRSATEPALHRCAPVVLVSRPVCDLLCPGPVRPLHVGQTSNPSSCPTCDPS